MKEQKEALNTLPQQSGAGSPAPRVFLCHLPGLRRSLNTLPQKQANPAHQEPNLGLYAQAEGHQGTRAGWKGLYLGSSREAEGERLHSGEIF